MKTPAVHPSLAALLLLASVVSASADDASKNLLPEGTFESFKPGFGNPPGFASAEPGDWMDKGNLSIAIGREDNNSFLRLQNPGTPDKGYLRLNITVYLPAPAPQTITVGWRVRSPDLVTTTDQSWASVQVEAKFLDKKGKEIGVVNGINRLTRKTPGWIEREQEVTVPAGAAEMVLQPSLYGVSGTVDLDDITVLLP